MQEGQSQVAASQEHARYSHYDVLAIAAPIMLSNATVPLIGFTDTAVIGQLGVTHLIGAVSIAAASFSVLFLAFGFLRMGTTGLTAQAVGAGDRAEVAANLARALMVAVAVGVLLIVLQIPIKHATLWILGASDLVSEHAATYFEIRIWSAPAALANFALLGWFIGLRRADIAFYLQLVLNGSNILLSLLFVLGLNWSISGVAAASLAAEFIAVFIGLWLALVHLRPRKLSLAVRAVFDLGRLSKQFAVSRDILIRTVCLQAALAFFVSQGAQAGDTLLATNHILFTIVTIAIYVVDGFAYAAETLVGQGVGAGSVQRFRDAIYLSSQWGFVTSVFLAVVLWLSGTYIVDFMTNSAEVRSAARSYVLWAALVPLTSICCFILDGVFVGATATALMRNMMLISLAFYFVVWALCMQVFCLGNHGLWIALHAFFIIRGLTLGVALPKLERDLFSPTSGRAYKA